MCETHYICDVDIALSIEVNGEDVNFANYSFIVSLHGGNWVFVNSSPFEGFAYIYASKWEIKNTHDLLVNKSYN